MRWKLMWTIPLLIGLGVSCSDKVTEESLVGTWTASQFVFTEIGNSATEFDVIAVGGAVTLVIRANNTYSITFTLPGSSPDSSDGTWALSGDVLTLDEGTADETALDVSLSGSTLTIRTSDVTFDFGDGDVPARLEGTFTRQ